MVLNDRKDERMALNKKGGLGKGLGKGIDSLISNAYAVEKIQQLIKKSQRQQ